MADQPASSGLQQAQDQKLGQISAILQSSMTEEQKSAYAIKKEQEITNKQLKKQVTHDNWMMKWTKDQAKKALAMASRLKIDDIAKNMTEKASKFAGNLLDLLMKGLGLAALWKLLDWIATQDWVALYNEHKESLMKFFDAIKSVSAAVALWAGASWLINGPLHKLWKGVKGIFGLGGKFATMVGIVLGWTKNTLFNLDKDGALGKVWKAIKTIFGGEGVGGKFFGMIATVVKWSTNVMFDLTKGSLGLLWTALKTIFAVGGTIATLADDVQSKWTGTKMFGPDGALRRAWKGITTIFGDLKDGMIKKLLTFVDGIQESGTKMFGPDGPFQKSWSGIKSIFGAGKDAMIQKFVAFIDGIKEAKIFSVEGPFQKSWNLITGIFGKEGKIAKGFLMLKDAEDFVGEKSDTAKMFNWFKGLFGVDGKIAKNFTTIKATFGNFFGPGSPIDEVMKSINLMFGPESTIGKFLKPADDVPSGPGFIQRIKNIFSSTGAVGKLFGIFSGIGNTIGSVATKIMDSAPVKIMKKIFGFTMKVGGAAVAAGGTILATVGRIFAPLGWIMAIFEGVSGFIEGFKSQGKDDTRSMGEKITDGLKGAMNNLIDFFVVDLLGIIESVINFGIKMLNKLPGVNMKEVSFAEDVGNLVKGVSDKAIDVVMGDTRAAEAALDKQNQVMDSMLKSIGGNLDKGTFTDEVYLSGKQLTESVKGMGAGELAAMTQMLQKNEEKFGITEKDGPQWEKVIERRLKTMDDTQREMFKSMMASPTTIVQNTNQSGVTTFSVGGDATDPKANQLK